LSILSFGEKSVTKQFGTFSTASVKNRRRLQLTSALLSKADSRGVFLFFVSPKAPITSNYRQSDLAGQEAQPAADRRARKAAEAMKGLLTASE
jgi:hypothetical protein